MYCCERWLTAGKSEKWDVVSLKYEGVPSRAGKPSGWEARREKLTMEKSHIKLTWAATMALGGASSSCFTDTLSWSDCPFHLWSLLALSSGVKIAETRKKLMCQRTPLWVDLVSRQISLLWIISIEEWPARDDSAQLNFCVTPAVFRGRSHRRAVPRALRCPAVQSERVPPSGGNLLGREISRKNICTFSRVPQNSKRDL